MVAPLERFTISPRRSKTRVAAASSDVCVVVRGGYLDNIGPHDVDTVEAPQECQQLTGVQAAHLWCSGARSVRRVQHINVDGNVDRRIAQTLLNPPDGGGDTNDIQVRTADDLEPELVVAQEIVTVIDRPADTHVHGLVLYEQPFFEGEGQVILGDKGFAGRDFEAFITQDLGATLIRPDRKDEKPRFGNFGGIRQWIESVFDTLKGQLTLEQHGGRTLAGVCARVAARLLALAAGIWHNWRINAPRKRSLIAYDH